MSEATTGRCPICGRLVALRRDGAVMHLDRAGSLAAPQPSSDGREAVSRLRRDPDYLAWRAAMADDEIDRPGCALGLGLMASAFALGVTVGVLIARWLS